MSLSSNALCAKAKAMYGGRLNKNVYLDLTCSSWSNRRLFKSRILSSLCEVDEIFT